MRPSDYADYPMSVAMDCYLNASRTIATVLALTLAAAAAPAAEIVPPLYAGPSSAEASSYTCQPVGYSSYYDPCAGSACGAGSGCVGPAACTSCGAADCCGGCNSTCGPFWTVRAAAVVMDRDTPDSLILMENTDPNEPPRNLNSRDFNFDFAAGYDLSLIAQPQSGWGTELRLFSTQDISADATAETLTTFADPLQINTDPPTFVQDVAQVEGSYDSGFHSFELNFRKPCCDMAWLIGFRYLELDEQAVYGLTGSAPAATYYTNTQNRLYGVQAGAEGTLFGCGCFRLDGVAKGGVYYNAARHASFLINGVVTQPAVGNDDSTAFVGELGLFGVYDLSPCMALRFGYQGLFFESVTLASDQIPASNLFTQTGIDAEGGTFYHGGLIGVEFRR